MKSLYVSLVSIGVLTAPLALAQGRPLRLFFSNTGLSNPTDVLSPAFIPGEPTQGGSPLLRNPRIVTSLGTRVRLYVWAQLMGPDGTPPGTPNNGTYTGVSLTVGVTGSGGSVAGFNFWNYTNGAYGNGAGRWQQVMTSSNTTSVTFSGAAVVAGAGVNNTAAAVSSDAQHTRFAANGTTRIDSTLLGWVEVQSNQSNTELQLRFHVGNLGITQAGQPAQRIYMGWGDEASAPLGSDFGVGSPIADATILIPEPASLLLLGLAGLALRRR